LLVAPAIEVPPLTADDHAYVKDLKGATQKAVTENLEWLREMGHTGTVASIAKNYRLGFVNRHLREVTLDSDNDLPSLIVALNEDGTFNGSFIAH
jgi:hypothetical protein